MIIPKALHRFHYLKSWIFAKVEMRKNRVEERINSRQLFLSTYIATEGHGFRNSVPQLSALTETLQTIDTPLSFYSSSPFP